MRKILLILITCCSIVINAQVKIGNNPTQINSNAVLELESTSKGLLLPRLTVTQRDAIATPTNSMLIFNTTENCINIYNSSESKWKSVCGDVSSGSAVFSVDCASLLPSGNYYTGVALNPQTNYLTISVNVTQIGTYSMVVNSGGMYFSAAGNFTSTGLQDITLTGQGYPLVAGLNFIGLQLNDKLCTAVINVQNGIANITGCGTLGALTGNLYAGTPVASNTVYQSYTTGPSYTGGGAYGITSDVSNGIRISQPVNGTFLSSGAPIDYILSGTPLVPGTTVINYTINGFTCSFSAPVQSGTGRASAVSCSGALTGTYSLGVPMSSNTKVVTLTVTTPGTFNLRTNTANGIYFQGTATAASAGSLNVTLTAIGTPISNTTNTFTVTVSNAATTFTSCTFDVTTTIPSAVTAFNTLNCNTLSESVSYIKASNTGVSDVFGGYMAYGEYIYGKGTKISADGLTLAVGAIGEDGDLTGGAINSADNNNWTNAGAVYIYTRTSTSSNWTFQAKLKPTQLSAMDYFGNSLDISNDGNTLVVGSLYEDRLGTGVNPPVINTGTDAGAAYVFVRNAGVWTQQAYLKANNSRSYDLFGGNVAISGDGNTIAIGAIGEDSGSTGINSTPVYNTTDGGAVYTYTRSGSTWSFDAYIKPSMIDGYDWFGTDVALNDNGNVLVVGSSTEDGSNSGVNQPANNSAADAGAAYVFRKNSGTWSQQAYLKASQVTASDQFGVSVDIDGSGNNIIVGGFMEDGNGANVNPPANDSMTNAGAAYIFNYNGSSWSQVAYLKASYPNWYDDFGRSVTISNDGNNVLVGCPNSNLINSCVNSTQVDGGNDVGAMYMFSKSGGSWINTFEFKYPTSSLYDWQDYFGECVSLSGDGKTVVSSMFNEDGSGSGINPTPNNSATSSGAVIVYTKN